MQTGIRSIALSLLLASTVAFAEPAARLDKTTPQSYDDLFQVALQMSPTYRNAVEQSQIARFTLYRAWGDFLPGLDASSRFSTSNTRYYSPSVLGSGSSSNSSYGFGLSLPIWDGGVRYGVLANARLGVKAAPVALLQSEQQLGLSLRQAFDGAIASGELVKTARSSVALRQELVKLAEAKYNVGASTQIDVLSTQLQLGTARNLLLQALQDSITSRESLNQVIGIALDSKYELNDADNREFTSLELSRLVELAQQQAPSVKLAKVELERAKNSERISRATWHPSVNLSQSYDWSRNLAGSNKWTTGPGTYNSSTSLSLNYTIFTGFAQSETREKAQVALKQAEWTYRSSMLSIEANIRTAYSRYELARSQLLTAKDNVDLARRQRELEQERYRVGSSTLLLVQNAQDAELTAETQYIKTRLSARTALAALELAVGCKLAGR